MEVHLTPDQEAFIRQAIESGRLAREEDAVRQAMSLWEERERRRAEILAAVDEADASLARGEGRSITTHEEATQLANDIQAAWQAAACRRAEPQPMSEFRLSPEAEAEIASRRYPGDCAGCFWSMSSNPANRSAAATSAISDPSHASWVTALRVV
jgi:putative addiction module CopG family antidote